MAKVAKTGIKKGALDTESKNFTKVIKTVRSPKTGAYSFKESIIHKSKVKALLSEK